MPIQKTPNASLRMLVCVALFWACLSLIHISFAIGALAEIPVMGLTARIIRRFGARRVLLVALSLIHI